MEKKQFRGEYLAPKVKVVKMRSRQHMLSGSFEAKGENSLDGTEQYDEGSTEGWF